MISHLISLVVMETKRVKRPRGVGGARKKIKINDSGVISDEYNKENINPNTESPSLLPSSRVISINEIERRLVLEQRYSISQDNLQWIAIGVDPLDNFNVVIRMVSFNSVGGIQFSVDAFDEFLSHRETLMKYLSGETNIEYHFFLGYELFFQEINGTRMITIKKGSREKCLYATNIMQMFNICHVFLYYINLLNNLKFSELYYKALIIARDAKINSDILNIMENMTNVVNTLDFLGIKEMIAVYPEVIYTSLLESISENIL